MRRHSVEARVEALEGTVSPGRLKVMIVYTPFDKPEDMPKYQVTYPEARQGEQYTKAELDALFPGWEVDVFTVRFVSSKDSEGKGQSCDIDTGE